MYNQIDGSPCLTAHEIENERAILLHDARSSIVGYRQSPLTPAQVRSGRTGIAFLLALPWLAALVFVLAHGFERHQFPALPYGIPLLIGIMVACLGILITTRFKFSWMVLSFAAATYAAFNL